MTYFRIKSKQPANKTSYIFWGSVVACISVLIYSHCYCGNDWVLDFFSLASAIISIILAIITIVYSFYTNSRSNGQTEILNRAAKDVQKASQSYSESAESLELNIAKIISAINRVEAKTDRLLGYSLYEGSGAPNNMNFDVKKYVEAYVNISSPLGIMAMYACILSKDKSIPLHISLLSTPENQMYCAGFLIATTATGIVNSTIDFETGNIKVVDYVESVKHDIEQWFKDNHVQGPLLDLKNQIDSYFQQSSK